MNADQKWKSHKASCPICSIGKTFDLDCEEGQELYRIRLSDPTLSVRLTEKGKRGQV